MMNRIRKSVAVLFCITTICSFFTSMSISADTSVNTVKYEQTFETNDGTFEANGTTMNFVQDADGTNCLEVTKPSGTDYWMAARPKSSVLVPIVRANGAGVYRYKAKYKTESGTFDIKPVVSIRYGSDKIDGGKVAYSISSDKWTEVCFDVVVSGFDTEKLSAVYIGQQLPKDGKDKEYKYYIGYMSFEKVVGYENNLITYGDFEDDQTTLTSYFAENDKTSVTMERVSNGDNTYSLRVTKASGYAAAKSARPKADLLASKVKEKGAGIYRYKARYKSDSKAFTIKPQLNIQFSDGIAKNFDNGAFSVNPSSWTEVSFDFTLDSVDKMTYVFINQILPNTDEYTYYIDYMSLEKIGETGENVVSCAKKYVGSDGTEITDIVNYSGDFTVQYTVKNAGGTDVGVAVVTAVKNSVSLTGVDLINDTASANNKAIATKTLSKKAGETVDTYCWDNLENMRPWLASK